MNALIFLAGVLGITLSGWFLPWWGLFAPALIIGLLSRSSWQAFLQGLGAGFAVWLVMAVYRDWESGFRLGGRLADIFSVYWPVWIVFATGLIGGLGSGLSSLSGYYFGQMILNRQNTAAIGRT